MLATPQEMFLDAILDGTLCLKEKGSLLVVSDAELLAGLSERDQFQVLLELNRLPHALLLGTVEAAVQLELPNIVSLACPGLKEHAEARALFKIERSSLKLVDSAVEALCRESRVSGVGIVPGRLLFLAGLGHAMLEPAGLSGNRELFPDDVFAAIGVAKQAWRDERKERKQ